MTISTTPSEKSYLGDGVSTSFPIPFVFDAAADLRVIETDEDGNTSVVTTGFTVTGGDGSTGTLTYATAPAEGITITILDDPELKQSTDYVSNDPFPVEAHERALDRGVRISKRLYQLIRRCLRTDDGDPIAGTSMVLPSAVSRAGKFLRFNDSGAPEMADFDGAGTPISQSIIGNLLYPQTAAESAAGKNPPSKQYEPGHILRYIPTDEHAAILAGTSTYNASSAAQDWLDSLQPGDTATVIGVVRAQDLVLTTSDITFAGGGWLKPVSNASAASILTIGSDSPSTLVRRVRGNLRLGDPEGGVSTWSNIAGLTLLQAVECEVGLDFRGLGVGWNGVPALSAVAYNVWRLGAIINCKLGVLANPGGSGYVNENIFIGGRFTLTTAQYEPGCVSIDLRNPTANTPNNNRFIGPSFEGPAQYINCAGTDNVFTLARSEPGTEGAAGVDYAETIYDFSGSRNVLEFAYNSDWLAGAHAKDHGAATRVDDMSFTIAGADLRDYFFPGAWAAITVAGATHIVPVRGAVFEAGNTRVLLASALVSGDPTAVVTARAKITGAQNVLKVVRQSIPAISAMTAEARQDALIWWSRCSLYLAARGGNYPAITLAPGGSENDVLLQVMGFIGRKYQLSGTGEQLLGNGVAIRGLSTLGATRHLISLFSDDIVYVGTNTNVLRLDGSSYRLSTTPPDYVDDAAAAAGGVPVNGIYRTGSTLRVRVA